VGAIHTDVQRGFIRAEAMSSDGLIAMGSEQKVRDAGRMRSERREYVVQDGDIIFFCFNVRVSYADAEQLERAERADGTRFNSLISAKARE
jgi:hypothetical protein